MLVTDQDIPVHALSSSCSAVVSGSSGGTAEILIKRREALSLAWIHVMPDSDWA